MDTKFEKETENLVVFKDINPQATIHLLIVPKTHYKDMADVNLPKEIWEEIREVAVGIARAKAMSGFRLITNAGDSAAIPHLHVHLLGDIAPERAV